MTTINLDQFEERLMQRANAEQNIANRLYSGEASKESYMQASVTAAVLREVAHSIAQMKEDHTVTVEASENRNYGVGLVEYGNRDLSSKAVELIKSQVDEIVELWKNVDVDNVHDITNAETNMRNRLCTILKVVEGLPFVSENRNVEVYPGILREYVGRLLEGLEGVPVNSKISTLIHKTRKVLDMTGESNDNIREIQQSTEAWELEQLVEAKDDRINQLEAKVENLEGHLKQSDKQIEELEIVLNNKKAKIQGLEITLEGSEARVEKMEKKLDHCRDNYSWLHDNNRQLSEKYDKFRAILRDRSQMIIHELNRVSNPSEMDVDRCYKLAEDLLLLSKGEIRAAEAERVMDPEDAIMDMHIVDFMDMYDDLPINFKSMGSASMTTRIYNILRFTDGRTVREVYEHGTDFLRGFGPDSLKAFRGLVDRLKEEGYEQEN